VLGLLLNAVAGWWWADPLAGLLIALIALREAKETFVEANGISA
jgi:divalent metal cation (Fe/Co/Zn/Cd) transporter